MESYQIIAGFSDIKSDLQNKTSKSMEELRLWFSFEDDMLLAHDYMEHACCTLLAIYKEEDMAWRVIFKERTFGRKLIEWIINKSELDKVAQELNSQYRLHGFSVFTR